MKMGILQAQVLWVQIFIQGDLRERQVYVHAPTYTYKEVTQLLELVSVVEHKEWC